MLRPPQPAVYLFLLDVSHSAIESGYLQVVCDVRNVVCCASCDCYGLQARRWREGLAATLHILVFH